MMQFIKNQCKFWFISATTRQMPLEIWIVSSIYNPLNTIKNLDYKWYNLLNITKNLDYKMAHFINNVGCK